MVSIKPPFSEQIFTLLTAALWDEFWWRQENVGNKRRALKSLNFYWKTWPAGETEEEEEADWSISIVLGRSLFSVCVSVYKNWY